MRRAAGSRPPEGIARNTAYAFGVQIATSVFTATLTLFLVRALGPEGYGAFALALAVGGLVSIPSDLGISGAAARFAAEARSDRSAVARVVSDALVFKVGASAVTSLVLLAAAPWLAGVYDEPDLVWPLRAIAFALFGQSVMSLFRGVFIALGRNSIDLRLVTSESALETGATIGLVLLGTGAAGAAFGRAVGYGFGAALGTLLVTGLLGRQAIAVREFRWSRARPLARYAGAIGIVEGAWLAFGQVDALVVGGFLGAAAVGIYRAPMRFIVFLQQPAAAVANAVVPRLARSGDEQPAVAAFVAALRYVILFQALLIPPLVVWAVPLTSLLLGPGYEQSADVLRALTPFVFLSGIATLLSLAANFLGEARRRVPIALATLALDIALAVVLVPTVGVVGAAIATAVAYFVYTVGHLWICLRILPLPLQPILLSTARAAVAAVAACAVLGALGTDRLDLLDWVLGALCAPAAFLLVLVATRELGRRDVAEIRSFVARARG